jgi:pantothenate kinase
MSERTHSHAVDAGRLAVAGLLPDGALGVDAGMTLTKFAHARHDGVDFTANETHAALGADRKGIAIGSVVAAPIGVTGALIGEFDDPNVVRVQEIDAGARGVVALLKADGRDAGDGFIMALLGTGTAFAAVRGAQVQHLGGTPLGGGSFSGIACRVEPSLSYEAMIAGAERGDRRRVDAMIADLYPAGIGQVGPDLTAAHLVRAEAGSLDDFLAGLLNLHAEDIAQIAASRARIAGLGRIVLAGGFTHNNPRLVDSITSMARLFGVSVETVSWPGYAGALGAALLAYETDRQEVPA